MRPSKARPHAPQMAWGPPKIGTRSFRSPLQLALQEPQLPGNDPKAPISNPATAGGPEGKVQGGHSPSWPWPVELQVCVIPASFTTSADSCANYGILF